MSVPVLEKKENGAVPASDVQNRENVHVTFRDRIVHVTWAWFIFPLSTGAISLLLFDTTHRFKGLTTIGKVFFIFQISVSVLVFAAITTRFILKPQALKNSLTHPTEALFFPAFLLNFAVLIAAGAAYATPYCGRWWIDAVYCLFWIYMGLSFPSAVLQYLHLFRAQRLTIQSMTPAWILPMFEVHVIMLTGVLAALVAPYQPPDRRMVVIIAGLTFNGCGWTVAFLMYALYLHRMLQHGLPAPNFRPGMFIAVGPPAFTGFALTELSNELPKHYGIFADSPLTVPMLQALAHFVAIYLWTMAFFFFSVSLLAVLMGVRQMSFHLIWWGMVFPNCALALATIAIGESLQSQGILWVATAMTCVLVAMWLFVLAAQIRAVLKKQILMPGKDEDKDQFREDDEKGGVRCPV